MLPGIEDELLEYLSSMIADEEGGPTRALEDEVAPFLLDGLDTIKSDEDAAAKCKELEKAIADASKASGGPDEKAAPAAFDPPKRELVSGMKLGDHGSISAAEQHKLSMEVWGNALSKYNEVTDSICGDMKKEKKSVKAAMKALSRQAPGKENQAESTSQLTAMLLPDYSSGATVKDIFVDKVSIYTPKGDRLLDDAAIRLTYARRYGLVGKNGIGKTTLLKAIAAHQVERFPTNLRILHVSQEAGTSDALVLQAVLEADTELQALRGLEKELTKKSDAGGEEGERAAAELQEVYERLKEIGSDTAEARAGKLLAGLRFSPEMQQAKISSLSGGWRVRAAIASALFIKPELLMLDEPTNHLDLEAVLWLSDHLQSYPHTIVIVSHDRAFLNDTVTDIVQVEAQKLKYFKGDYDMFEKTRGELLRNQIKEYERYKAERAHMQEFVDSFRYNAKRASLVQSRLKAIKERSE